MDLNIVPVTEFNIQKHKHNLCFNNLENKENIEKFKSKATSKYSQSKCSSESIRTRDLESMVSLLESRAKLKNSQINPKFNKTQGICKTECPEEFMVENQNLKLEQEKLRNEILELSQHKELMKNYILSLEKALLNLQKPKILKPETQNHSTKSEKFLKDDFENDFRVLYLKKAFKGFLKARDDISIQRYSEVICALLDCNDLEKNEIIASVDVIKPILKAFGTYEYFIN